MSVLEVFIIISIGVLVLLAFIFFMLQRQMKRLQQAANKRYPDARLVVSGANFFGQESLGMMQLRGNGTLVLTDDELYFEKWLPRREYRIPLSSIQAIEMPRSFLGKTVFSPLVKVQYRTEGGQTDAIAWFVPDADGLIRAIEEARS